MYNENNLPEAEEMTKNEKNGNLTVKRSKTVDFIAKIVCFVVAFIIWFFAAENDTALFEERFSSIPVEIVNESGFSVLSGDDVTVDVTLSGKRNVINRIKSSDIRAYIDMSSITEAGKHKFDIKYDLPNGVNLEKSTSNSITVYADNTSSVTVPVKTEVMNVMLDSGFELGTPDITTDIKNIIVTGPEAVISTIKYARLSADMAHRPLTGTVSYGGDVVLVDGDGKEIDSNYVKMNVSYVTATIPIYKYREVPVEIVYKYGYFNEKNVSLDIEPKTVKIKGEASIVDSVVLKYEIDEKKTNENSEQTFKLSLPSGVKAVNAVDSVKVSVELVGISTRTITVYNKSVINPNGLSYAPITENINITVRGDTSMVSKLSSVYVTGIIDLGASEGVTGAVMVPMTFTFAAPFDGNVYEIGSYSVSVILN